MDETVQKLFSDKGYELGTKEGYDAYIAPDDQVKILRLANKIV